MKLIDKDAVVAEIERLKQESEAKWGWIIAESVYDKILSFINTLEVKEVDLSPTLEDISIIRQIMFDYNRQIRNEMTIPNDKEYCHEVLKQFKAQKGEEV